MHGRVCVTVDEKVKILVNLSWISLLLHCINGGWEHGCGSILYWYLFINICCTILKNHQKFKHESKISAERLQNVTPVVYWFNCGCPGMTVKFIWTCYFRGKYSSHLTRVYCGVFTWIYGELFRTWASEETSVVLLFVSRKYCTRVTIVFGVIAVQCR
jgi:hypothetical protein